MRAKNKTSMNLEIIMAAKIMKLILIIWLTDLLLIVTGPGSRGSDLVYLFIYCLHICKYYLQSSNITQNTQSCILFSKNSFFSLQVSLWFLISKCGTGSRALGTWPWAIPMVTQLWAWTGGGCPMIHSLCYKKTKKSISHHRYLWLRVFIFVSVSICQTT